MMKNALIKRLIRQIREKCSTNASKQKERKSGGRDDMRGNPLAPLNFLKLGTKGA
ncbi:MAG: hypothetical protein MRY79_02345 [Alphaproteobacteria bacterium]|nr:hypothetical protein [Alphaproteobacteria bacterium]